ncbi:MAG: sigma-70 family RNA polymerase sigma factor [Bacteroidota bacterium]
MRTEIWQGGSLDLQAQRRLFEQYGERLYRIAYRYLGDRMAAEDATSEAFVNIFGGIAEQEFAHRNLFEAWIRRIVINQALERLRRQKRWQQERDLPMVQSRDGEEDVLAMLSLQEVMRLIKRLPKGYRTIIQLYVFDGFTHADIAKALGISVGTSKSQLNKARSYLKRQLKKTNSV